MTNGTPAEALCGTLFPHNPWSPSISPWSLEYTTTVLSRSPRSRKRSWYSPSQRSMFSIMAE